MFKYLFAWNAWLIIKLPLTLIAFRILFVMVRFVVGMNLRKKHYSAQNIEMVTFMRGDKTSRIAEAQTDPVGPLREAIKKDKDAKAFLLQLGPIQTLCLVDSAYIKAFSDKLLVDFDRLDSQKTFELLMKRTISGLNGEDYKLHRKIFSNGFNLDTFEKNLPQCQKITSEILESLADKAGGVIDAKKELRQVFSGIISQNFFGENIDQGFIGRQSAYQFRLSLFNQLFMVCYNPLVMIFGSGIVKRGLLKPHRNFMENITKYYGYLQKKIEEKRAQFEKQTDSKGPCILEYFLNAQKEFPEKKAILDDESIAGEFLTLLYYGNNTEALLIAETLYCLALYPDLHAELVREIQKHIPDGKVTSISQLNKLELMHSTLKEVLRLFAPVGITVRQAQRDTEILDIKVRKGDYVGVGIQANNSNPKYWDDPEKFNPKRFMKESSSLNKEPFAFLSFSYGRDCVGQQVALIYAKLVLTTFLTMFDFKLTEGYKMQLTFELLYEPVNPIKLILKRKGDGDVDTTSH